MSYKRQQSHTMAFEPSQNASPYNNELQTIGMRIRKAVNDGYQTPDNLLAQINHQQTAYQQKQSQQEQQSSSFSRVPLPSNVVTPPLLSNATSTMYSTYGSNLEEWEKNIETRLNHIEENMNYNKIPKRSFSNLDEDW